MPDARCRMIEEFVAVATFEGRRGFQPTASSCTTTSYWHLASGICSRTFAPHPRPSPQNKFGARGAESFWRIDRAGRIGFASAVRGGEAGIRGGMWCHFSVRLETSARRSGEKRKL
jgi:hypothetical protein